MPSFERTQTDEAGRFQLPTNDLSRYFLNLEESRVVAWKATGDGRMFAARETVVEEVSLELNLAEVPTVRGTVVDGFGAPVPEAEVALRPGLSDGGSVFRKAALAAVRAVGGSFSVPVLSVGTFQLEARAAGYTLRAPRVLDLPADAALEQRLVMDRSATIEGVVLTPDGVPAPDARVWPMDPEAAPWAVSPLGGSEEDVHADGDGRFVLAELPPGLVEVRAAADGWATSMPLAVELAPGERRTGVEVRLQLGGTIEGEVLNSEGGPAPGAAVMAIEATVMDMAEGETDEDGRFRLEALKPGRWQLQVLRDPEFEMDPSEAAAQVLVESVDVGAGETVHVTIGGLRADAVSLSGTVTFGGKPFETDLAFIPDRPGRGIAGVATTDSGSDGRYTVELPEPGPWLVIVSAASDLAPFSQAFDVPAGAAHRLDFALPSGRIEGHVLRGGEPVEDALVRLQRADGLRNGMSIQFNMPELETLNDGSFAFEGLSPGVYDVVCGGASKFAVFGGSSESVHPLVVAGGLRVGPDAEITGVVIQLTGVGRLEGRVLDANGKPVPSASVWFRDEAGRIVELLSTIATDGAGRFPPQQLVPGNYTVLARSPSLVAIESEPVRVVADETATVQLLGGPGTVLRLQIEPADGSGSLGGTRVEVWDEAGRALHGLTGLDIYKSMMSEGFSSTHPRLGPLAAGRYRVRVTAGDGRTAEEEVVLAAPQAQDGTQAEVQVILRVE